MLRHCILLAQSKKGRKPKGEKSYTPWNNDSGGNPSKSSNAILIGWFSEPRNFARWKGSTDKNDGNGGQHGETKEALLKEIKREMEKVTIFHRSTKDIRARIQYINKQYNETLQWFNQTGPGIRAGMENGDAVDPAEREKTIRGISLVRHYLT